MRIVTSLTLLTLVTVAYGIRFNVPANNKKCMKEEIHKNIVVTGEYEFSEAIGYTGSVHVSFIDLFLLILTVSILIS
ncbi:hypothetical protein COOONC_23507 [Cooperia oncophora]